MYRKLSFSISFVLLISLATTVQANLLVNPGFEDGIVGRFGEIAIPNWVTWGSSGWHHNDIGYTHDTKAVKEWWDDTGISQDFAVTEENNYTFNVWAISSSSDAGGLGGWDAVFKVEWYDNNWSEISNEEISRFYGYRSVGNYPNPGDPLDTWKLISSVKTAPSGAVNGRVVLAIVDGDQEWPWLSEHRGSVNWDDVSVVSGGDATIAWNPIPLNEDNNISQAVVLTWSAGDYADKHDVYFGTDLNEVNTAEPNCLVGDVNCSGRVDLDDIIVLSQQWLTDASALQPSAELNSDNNVNLLDFALIANDWMKETAYKGRQDTTSYDPCGLEEGVIYYWRIDEVNEANPNSPWRGIVWSFTVISIDDLISQMTLEEKVAQMGGGAELMTTPDNTRLGIPGFKMADGPHGVREWGNATSFPGVLSLGATWDTALVQQVGEALGREFRGKARYVGLAPCINIIRDPRGGRSFETFGEDPYLVGKLAVEYVKGVQNQKVISVVKHFACNNQENDRGINNVIVNERTLREIYLPAFKMCVKDADALGIMSAYNKVNGPYCSESTHLLKDILKDEWGFEGFVVTDWGACHSTIESANAGLDVEMPYANYFGQPLVDAVNDGYVLEDTIDEAVRRIIWTKSWAGVFERPATMNESVVNTPEHQALTLEAAKKAIVLLKNTAAQLPVNKTAITNIAVIGPNANIARHCGGGSCYVSPYYKVSPLEGIQNELSGSGVTVSFSQGCYIDSAEQLYTIQSSFLKPPGGTLGEGLQGEYFTNKDLSGSSALTRNDAPVDFDWGGNSPGTPIGTDNFSVKWTGKLVPTETGQYTLSTKTDDGVRLYINSSLLIDDWNDHGVKTNSATISLNASQEYDIRLEYYENSGDAIAKLCWTEPSLSEEVMIAEACQIATNADIAVVFVGTTEQIESEGIDRAHLDLPGSQDALIAAVAVANPNTIVGVVSGSAVLMNDWINDVPAVLQCWFNGQETGNAIAAVLFGEHNPAGKLPVTFPLNEAQMPTFDNNYEAAGEGPGYRYYDRNLISPLFVFGHGLSYTEFEYSNLQITPAEIPVDGTVSISVDVENIGNRAGGEVVQLYIHDISSSVLRVVKELKGFERISLETSQIKTVTFELPASDLAFYDVGQDKFVVEPGTSYVMVGSSSADIRLTGSFDVE
jgi:beta-glucosidase